MKYKYFIYISKYMRSIPMNDKVNAIDGKEVKRNKWQEYQERFAQYSANFQTPNKPNSVFTVNGSNETNNTAFGG